MASNIHYDKRRRHWWMKWHDGRKWRKKVLGRVPDGWNGRGRPPVTREVHEAAARLVEAERAARSTRSPAAAAGLSVREFVEADVARIAAPRTRTTAGVASRPFLAFCQRDGVRLVSEVTRDVCRRFLEERAGQIARTTLAAHRGYLSGIWARAVAAERAGANPWAGLKVPGKPEPKQRGSWTPEQLARLLKVCRKDLRDLLTLGTQCGLRVGALIGLSWRDVRWPSDGAQGLGKIVLPARLDKVGRGYEVPLSRTAADLLSQLRRGASSPDDRVLVTLSGKPFNYESVRARIKRACGRAGLPEPDSPTHHMRRTFGRWAVLGQLTGRPVPMYVCQRWLGHSRITTTQIYLAMDEAASAHWMEEAAQAPSGQNPDDLKTS